MWEVTVNSPAQRNASKANELVTFGIVFILSSCRRSTAAILIFKMSVVIRSRVTTDDRNFDTLHIYKKVFANIGTLHQMLHKIRQILRIVFNKHMNDVGL